MIDTIKIYTMINKNTYHKIYNNSIIKSSYNRGSGEVYYEIVNDKLEGSYSSSLSVRVGSGAKYGFVNMYYIEIEGSYHKIINGFNSHNGYYNLQSIVKWLIGAVENSYGIVLPILGHWFLQRIDIAICFDLEDNAKVAKYISNLGLCDYPRRRVIPYPREGIECVGTSTTLKIYNKLLEFKKHDMKKFYGRPFDLEKYMNEIKGLIRFECEVKKKKLQDIYGKKYIRIKNVRYEDLKEVWKCEFMRLLSFFESDLTIVRNKEDIKRRLYTVYGDRKGNILYTFYSSIVLDGLKEVKNSVPKTTYYRNIKELKACNIDLSQKYTLSAENDTIDFNPFTWKEVV